MKLSVCVYGYYFTLKTACVYVRMYVRVTFLFIYMCSIFNLVTFRSEILDYGR
jgi:hypothetical protein